MAEFIREEADMDAVVTADGAKVAFTATLKGAASDVVPGDTAVCRIVGYESRYQDWLWCSVHDHPRCVSEHTQLRLTAIQRDSAFTTSLVLMLT